MAFQFIFFFFSNASLATLQIFYLSPLLRSLYMQIETSYSSKFRHLVPISSLLEIGHGTALSNHQQHFSLHFHQFYTNKKKRKIPSPKKTQAIVTHLPLLLSITCYHNSHYKLKHKGFYKFFKNFSHDNYVCDKWV